MNTMLEKAARAASDYIDQSAAGEFPDDKFTVGLARAVLMAVREEAAGDELFGQEACEHLGFAGLPLSGVFTAMIDHILSEGEG